MRHPFWILNSALLFLSVTVFFLIFFWQEPTPSRVSIKPDEPKVIKRDISTIDISKIYKGDLFDTYKTEFPQKQEREEEIPIPEPPQPEQPKQVVLEKPEFLEPLPIELKGIIVVSNDEVKNRAVIESTKTKTEQVYKIGDKIEDAQLRRIFKNKVIFIRSNGQQEVLYLREKDAKVDPMYGISSNWSGVITKIGENNYMIDPKLFVKRIKNLAQLIDVLDLTTVYKQGKSIGTRVGSPSQHTLATALGLQKGDLIVKINDIPTTNTPQRFKIYKEIASGKNNIITVKLLRGENEITIQYELQEIKKHVVTPELSPKKIKEDEVRILQQKNKYAPTLREIRKRERQYLAHGAAPSYSLSR